MPDNHHSSSVKWIREWREACRLGGTHLRVLQYCETGLQTHPTGIFFITSGTIAEMTMDSRDEVNQALEDLERAGLLYWDRTKCVVWVPCVCAERFPWNDVLGPSEHQLQEARAHIANLPPSVLVRAFLNTWPIFKPVEATEQGTPGTTDELGARPEETETLPPTPYEVDPSQPRRPDLSDYPGKQATPGGQVIAREDIDWLVLRILSAMTSEEFDAIRARITKISILDFEKMSTSAKQVLQDAIRELLRAIDVALEEKQKH